MADFEFTCIRKGISEEAAGRTCIWIWYANRIPPHIGISSGNAYYSLKVSGKDNGIPVSGVLETIRRKNIPSILIELGPVIAPDYLRTHFDRFETAAPGEATCLTPIRSVFGLEQVTRLTELLHELDKSGAIFSVYGAHLPKNYRGLPEYSDIDIQKRLKELDHAKRKEHTAEKGRT